MNSSASISHEPNSTSTLLVQPGVLVVRRHHILVRCSHWLNIPLLLGLILSGNVTGGIVPNSGHWIMEENPQATIKLVTDFLNA